MERLQGEEGYVSLPPPAYHQGPQCAVCGLSSPSTKSVQRDKLGEKLRFAPDVEDSSLGCFSTGIWMGW
jgi:hypothetical protein